MLFIIYFGQHDLVRCIFCKYQQCNYTVKVVHGGKKLTISVIWGFPGGTSGKEPTCLHRRSKRCWCDPWAGKIPWRRAWHPTPVFLLGESHGQRSLAVKSPQRCRVGQDRNYLVCTHTSVTYFCNIALYAVILPKLSSLESKISFSHRSPMSAV